MAFNSNTAKKAGKKSTRQGVPNKATANVRELIASFVENKFEQVTNNFDKLEPSEQWKVIRDLLPYCAPKLQSTSLDFGFEQMSDSELDLIIHELKKSATNG